MAYERVWRSNAVVLIHMGVAVYRAYRGDNHAEPVQGGFTTRDEPGSRKFYLHELPRGKQPEPDDYEELELHRLRRAIGRGWVTQEGADHGKLNAEINRQQEATDREAKT